MNKDTVQLLMDNGVSRRKALKISATKNAWQIRKHVLERPLKTVPEWRCPVHGCLINISYCISCRIDAHRKIEKLAKTFRRKP